VASSERMTGISARDVCQHGHRETVVDEARKPDFAELFLRATSHRSGDDGMTAIIIFVLLALLVALICGVLLVCWIIYSDD
jgi:hypothetical protein